MATSVPTTTTTPPPRPAPARKGSGGYAVTVRRARRTLQVLLLAVLGTGLATTVVSFLGVNDALARYSEIVDDSAVSADAAQLARSALLAHHSAAADFLSLRGTAEADTALRRSDAEWREYQEQVRRVWGNRSDQQFGEYAVFEAADRATWRYRQQVDAMVAFARVDDTERSEETFLAAHDILIQEALPALNGLESVKLESMESAYATTNAAISGWQQGLLLTGGVAVVLLLLALGATRFWLHYAWTWELVLASLAALLLFVWFNLSLAYAAGQVRVLVRNAYDSISGAQAVEAMLTQAEAVESMAIFRPDQADAFLRDADEYLFLLEQRLCGEPQGASDPVHCTDATFLDNDRISAQALEVATTGRSKYSLTDPPLVLNAATNDFAGEPRALEMLREAIAAYRAANTQLRTELSDIGSASVEQRSASTAAYEAALAAIRDEQQTVRTAFNGIYSNVTLAMSVNRWLAVGFAALGLLGFWGLRRRRNALFVST